MQDELLQLVNSNKNFTKFLQSKKANKELVDFVNSFEGSSLLKKVYSALNPNFRNTCKFCSLNTEFISLKAGYKQFCNLTCKNAELNRINTENAVIKLNTFGNLEYISGYNHSHSRVTVRNKKCGCIFEATFINLFTNPDYCSTCGRIRRTYKLNEFSTSIWTPEHHENIRRKNDKIRSERTEKTELKNRIIESNVILNNEYSQFLTDFREKHLSHTERKLKSTFPSLFEKVNQSKGNSFWEKYFNLVNPDYRNECLTCGGPTHFRELNHSLGYRDHCSIICAQNNPNVRKQSRSTSMERYGVEHPSQLQETQLKKQNTNMERYGVSHVAQNKGVQDKIFKSQFRLKEVVLPSGRKIKAMGYEPQVIEHLLKTRYKEEDFSFSEIPTIRYNGGANYYFPDLYVPKDNLIIEVKSEYTYNIDLEKNKKKEEGTKQAGFNFEFIIWDDVNKCIIEII